MDAQLLEKQIPKQANFVLSLNLNSLSQKINLNDLGNYTFLSKDETTNKKLPKDVLLELFRLPEKAGINKTGKLYIYSEKHDSINNLTYLIPITNQKAFQVRILDILKNNEEKLKFKKEGKSEYLSFDHSLAISTNKDYAVISIWQIPYYYAYDYDEYNNERSRVIEIIDSIRFSNSTYDSNDPAEPEEETIPMDSMAIEEVDGTQESTFEKEEKYFETAVDSVEAVEMVEEVTVEDVYGGDSLMEVFEKQWTEKRKRREAEFMGRHDSKMMLRIKQITQLKPQDGASQNKEFTNVFSKPDDFIYWVDYDSYTNQLIDMVSKKSYYLSDTANERYQSKPVNNTLGQLFENNATYGLGNFDKGEIKMNFNSVVNNELKTYLEKIYSKDINPSFFNYVKSDNLIGLIAMSIHTEAAADMYYDILRRAVESSPKPKNGVLTALELTDLLLDKSVIHHTFKGDALVAITGIKSYLKTYTSYRYDSLTFESNYEEKTKTQYIPEFVMVMTIENMSNVKKIVKMIQRMDAATEVSEDVFSIKSRDKDLNGNYFITIKDNLFFITNDKLLATEQIKGGLNSIRTVGPMYNSYLTNTSFGFWDASKMFKLMAEGPEEKFGKPDMLEKMSEKINKGFFVTKPMSGNISTAEITLEMKNKENSSLLELLKLFDDLNLSKLR